MVEARRGEICHRLNGVGVESAAAYPGAVKFQKRRRWIQEIPGECAATTNIPLTRSDHVIIT